MPCVYTCVHNYSTGCVCVCVCVRKTEVVFYHHQQLCLKRLDKEGFVVDQNEMGNNVLWKLWNRETRLAQHASTSLEVWGEISVKITPYRC